MEKGNLYTEDSIESLSPLEFTRLRPGVYAGDTTYSTQLLVEALANSVDEFRLGHGNIIKITLDKDKIKIIDRGQGFIPNSFREDGKTILEAAFSVLNTSGKYRENGVYEGTSLGSFGIGAKIIVFLSHWAEISTWQNREVEKIKFKEGVFEAREKSNTQMPGSGTIVKWQPSEEFFTHTEVEVNKIKTLLKTITCLCPGLLIELTDNGTVTKYLSYNGLNDLVDEATKDKEILKNRLNISYSEGKNKLDLVMTYTSNYSSTIVPYVNTGLTESGSHITQIKTTLTREFNKFFREKKWLKEKDENLTGEDIQEGLYLVFNITTPNVSYDAQVKSRITKIETKPFVQILSEELQNWFALNEKEIKKIADKALNAKKARNAAKKAREASRLSTTKKKTGLKAKMALSDKFIDCKNKDPKKRNLLLVEGLSAGGSALEARNVETDCIYMLRGKIISPLKQSLEKILANQEISDIINVIGAGFGNENFDINKMSFDKIVITSDQDSDGQAIELLLITLFYTYMRPLVEAGKLYRAVTPLYIITTKKEKYYCYTEQELEEWKNSHTETYDLAHCKGLGEVSAEVLKEICFENQRFKRITVKNAEAAEKLLNILEGPNVVPRKQFIYDNASNLGFNFV